MATVGCSVDGCCSVGEDADGAVERPNRDGDRGAPNRDGDRGAPIRDGDCGDPSELVSRTVGAVIEGVVAVEGGSLGDAATEKGDSSVGLLVASMEGCA